MRIKLTDRFVKSATPGGRKSPIFMDDEVIGFGVQIRETGRKSFTLDYMFEGRRRRLHIGDFPDWSANAAREYIVGLTAFAAVHESEIGPQPDSCTAANPSSFDYLVGGD